jgi:hypothetical protein
MLRPDGSLLAAGYSGLEECKNQPDCEVIRDRGPIPRGHWAIGAPHDRDHSPYCLGLDPVGHDAHGRTAFLIHGDGKPGTPLEGRASHGCIILPRWAREWIWVSADHQLEVV